MMNWKSHWLERARKAAERRRDRYGITPPNGISYLLDKHAPEAGFFDTLKIILYLYFPSPIRGIHLLWRYLADRDTPARRRTILSLARALRSRLSPESSVLENYFERRNYSRDLASIPSFLELILFRSTPMLVVRPCLERDVAATVAFAREHHLSLFPRGSGSFAFGGAVPTQNGIVLDFSPMMKVLQVDPQAMSVRVQPGARWCDVAARLEPYDLVPMTTPSSRFSTVGGWFSTGGFGLGSFAHGHVSEAVLQVRAVRPSGETELLEAGDKRFQELSGTEGQFGILTEITLKARPKPQIDSPLLFTFPDPTKALCFLGGLAAGGFSPSHAYFFDKNRMAEENTLFRDRCRQRGEQIVPEQDAVLLLFEDRQAQETFLRSLPEDLDSWESNHVAARYLWTERFFPLKGQRIGPSLVGVELLFPLEAAAAFHEKAHHLAKRFKAHPAMEIVVCREGDRYRYLAILSMTCDRSRKLHYLFRLLLVQLLTRLGIDLGGATYGIGIWNTPFIESRYSPEKLAALKRRKQEIDPEGLLNPRKFFKVKGRFFGLSALFLQGKIYRFFLNTAAFFAPLLGLASRLLEPSAQETWSVPQAAGGEGKRLLRETALRCTQCGACISTCPAYWLTRDELVTGRSKLRMSEALARGAEIQKEEAFSPFQCLRCGLCEEVCQTRLPLRDCYLALEALIRKRYGEPVETIDRFTERLDANRKLIQDTFGLDLPEWSPEGTFLGIPEKRAPEKAEVSKP